jgi:S-(hydroxymethyl)glutathione dehydrogenase/alcohol dehydrogenase
MNAVLLTAYHEPFEIADIEIDKPRAAEIFVHTAASVGCHSDLHCIDGSLPSL